jgi:Ala-tRNA(Pro) deacylase
VRSELADRAIIAVRRAQEGLGMTIASRLKEHLTNAGVTYDVVTHPATPSSSRTAQAAHVPGDRLAKAVLLRDDQGWLLAVVPSTHRIDLDLIRAATKRQVELASEEQIGQVFSDCQVGAVPPIGAAYGVATLLDEALTTAPEVYLEGGDHTRVVRVSGADFRRLMSGAQMGSFGHHV